MKNRDTVKWGYLMIILAAASLLGSVSAFAAKRGGRSTAVLIAPANSEGDSGVHAHVGAGLLSMWGFLGAQIRLGAEFPVTKRLPILVGFDTGVMFGFGGVAIPLHATGTFFLDFGSKTFRPFVGLSTGPVISVSSGLYGDTYREYGYYGFKGFSWALLGRPGMQFVMTEKLALNTEVVFGGMVGGSFYMSPQASLVFKL